MDVQGHFVKGPLPTCLAFLRHGTHFLGGGGGGALGIRTGGFPLTFRSGGSAGLKGGLGCLVVTKFRS